MQARPEHAFEPEALAEWLREAIPDLGPLKRIRQLDRGQSNPTYRLDCAGGAAALRKRPPGALLPSAHRIDREWRFLKSLGSLPGLPVPVPDALAWCDDVSLTGTDFYVMRWVDGPCFHTPLLDGLDAERRPGAYKAYFRVLAALHKQDPEAIGLGDMGRANGYVARQIRRWSAQYEASQTRDVPEFDRLRDTLTAWRPPTESATAIAHGDFRFANVVFAPGAGRIAAVLDWELATLGDPMADLAFSCTAFRCRGSTPGFPGIRDMNRAAGSGFPGEEEALETYAAAGGAPVPGNWSVWIAYGLFRLAAISQGVFKRGMDGKASSSRWRELGPAVDALSRLGLESLEA